MYTLLFLDVDHVQSSQKADDRSPLALWLVTNIPGNMLTNFSEASSGSTILPYLAPLPNDERLHRYVFLLFRQEDGPTKGYHADHYSPKSCQAYFTGRFVESTVSVKKVPLCCKISTDCLLQ